ncbi:MAG: ankyrin repeat domain-containing protein [Syntrophomonadaceae bacterium]|nr:ankyrin repeat domain-containing protein [Syntrophomonadaceae bacterium]
MSPIQQKKLNRDRRQAIGIWNGNLQMARKALDHGADANFKDTKGQTLIEEIVVKPKREKLKQEDFSTDSEQPINWNI